MAYKGLAQRRVGSNSPSFYPNLTSTRAGSPAPVCLRGPRKFCRQLQIAGGISWRR